MLDYYLVNGLEVRQKVVSDLSFSTDDLLWPSSRDHKVGETKQRTSTRSRRMMNVTVTEILVSDYSYANKNFFSPPPSKKRPQILISTYYFESKVIFALEKQNTFTSHNGNSHNSCKEHTIIIYNKFLPSALRWFDANKGVLWAVLVIRGFFQPLQLLHSDSGSLPQLQRESSSKRSESSKDMRSASSIHSNIAPTLQFQKRLDNSTPIADQTVHSVVA